MNENRRKLSILTIWAHVGDHCDTAVGTRIIHADLGDEITSVVCSDGLRLHAEALLDEEEAPGRSPKTPYVDLGGSWDKWIEWKRRQGLRASEIMGVKETVFLGWDEDDILITKSRVEELGKIILRIKPDIIITHAPSPTTVLNEAWHTVTAQITTRAVRWAMHRIRQFDGVAAHITKEMFFAPQGMEIADSRDSFIAGVTPDIWIDITPVIDRKVRTCDCMSTQGRHGALTRKWIESQDGRWGTLAGCSYAEAFIRGGRTYRELPMPEGAFEQKFRPSLLYGDLVSAVNVPWIPQETDNPF